MYRIAAARISVNGTEVALAVDQGVAHGEVLGHADGGVVDRLVPMRVVLTHDITDDPRRFFVGSRGGAATLPHAIKNPPVHRFQSVSHIWQRATDDHRHRVVEIGLLELFLYGHMHTVGAGRRRLIGHLDVQVPGLESVGLDKVAAGFYGITHQNREELIGPGGILDRYL